MRCCQTMWRLYFVAVMAFGSIVACASAHGDDKGVFIKNEAITSVVLQDRTSEREVEAAEELSANFEVAFGQTLPIVFGAPDDFEGKMAVWIGRAAVRHGGICWDDFEKLGEDGYVIRVDRANVYIAGQHSRTTGYGVARFLEMLGWEFLSADAQIPPSADRIELKEGTHVFDPGFEMRLIDSGCALHGEHDLRQDVGSQPYDQEPGFSAAAKKAGWDHTSAYLVPFYLYGKSHPEYFSQDAEGQRIAERYLKETNPPLRNLHLCLSNPEVREIATKRLLAWIKAQPDRKFFAVTQADGYGWCQCEQCRALDTVPGNVTSDRLLDFVNELARAAAEKYPDKILVTLAYTRYTGPAPHRVKPAPNVRVMYCPYPPETPDPGRNLTDSINKQGYEWYRQWLAWCPGQVYIYDYPVTSVLAVEFLHESEIERVKTYAKDDVRGIYFCGRPMVFRALFDYVQGQLMWDPSLDASKLTQQFMMGYYREAAPQMFAIYKLYAERAADPKLRQGSAGNPLDFVTPELIHSALGLFAKAEVNVKDDPALLCRVKQEKAYLLYSDLSRHNPVTGEMPDGPEAFADRLAEYIGIVQDPHAFSMFGRQSKLAIANWFERIARIEIQHDPWYEDPSLKQWLHEPALMIQQVTVEARRLRPLSDGRGWSMPLGLFSGGRGPKVYGYDCAPKQAVWIYGALTRENRLFATFEFEHAPPNHMQLLIEAQDDDKPGATLIRITVNGEEIFRGDNGFVERGWSTNSWTVPDGVLKQGNNTIAIENLEESSQLQSDWFMISSVILCPLSPSASNSIIRQDE